MAKKSKVRQLLSHVWENCNSAVPHSYERLNHSMRNALELAIGSGFQFVNGDFELGEFRVGYWIGSDDEWCYSLAVSCGNLSAVKAWEAYKNREPLIADDVKPAESSGYTHMVGERDRERLHVGCYLPWKGDRVKVTSFRDGAAVACFYDLKANDGYERKPARRYTITREAIIAERAERKDRPRPGR